MKHGIEGLVAYDMGDNLRQAFGQPLGKPTCRNYKSDAPEDLIGEAASTSGSP